MRVQTYLYFDGCCEVAIDFYRKTLGAEDVTLLRFRDSPEPPPQLPPGCEDKVMHACFRIGDTEIMASDGFCTGAPAFQGFALTLVAADEAGAQEKFDRLAVGGEVRVPMARTFFSARFGMVVDRFGVLWNVLAEPAGRD